MKIPVIILNYNSSADCRKCIASLKGQTGVELEIVVVDNASPAEGEQEAVAKLCAEYGCTFIGSESNRGYNAGNNIGLRYASGQGCKYALIANPDMEFPQTDYILRLAAKMDEDEDIVVCGSDIVGLDGRRQSPSELSEFWMEIPFFGHFASKKQQKERMSCSGVCQVVAGCCLMVRLSYMEKIGYFDENVFLFCEEPILGRQAERDGKKIFYLHEAQAVHAHIESQKGSFKNRYDLWWKSRNYYLRTYCNYNKLQLAIIYFTRILYYICSLPKLNGKHTTV